MLREEGGKSSSWWKDLCSIREGVGVHNDMEFMEGVLHNVGNRESMSFWKDPWLNEDFYNLDLVVFLIYLRMVVFHWLG